MVRWTALLLRSRMQMNWWGSISGTSLVRSRYGGKGKGQEIWYLGSKGPPVGEEDPLLKCHMMGCQEVGLGNVLPGIWIPRDEKALVAKSDPVIKVKESWVRGSLH